MPFKSEMQRRKCYALASKARKEGKKPKWDCKKYEHHLKGGDSTDGSRRFYQSVNLKRKKDREDLTKQWNDSMSKRRQALKIIADTRNEINNLQTLLNRAKQGSQIYQDIYDEMNKADGIKNRNETIERNESTIQAMIKGKIDAIPPYAVFIEPKFVCADDDIQFGSQGYVGKDRYCAKKVDNPRYGEQYTGVGLKHNYRLKGGDYASLKERLEREQQPSSITPNTPTVDPNALFKAKQQLASMKATPIFEKIYYAYLAKVDPLYSATPNEYRSYLQSVGQLPSGGKMTKKQVDKLLQPKSKESFTKPIQEALDLLKIDDSDVRIQGTFGLRNAPYAGDIDTDQIIPICCNKQDATRKIVQYLQNAISKINNKKGYYLADLKAGLDLRYLIGIGDLKGNKTKGYKILNYDQSNVLDGLSILGKNGLLTSTEYDEAVSLAKPKITKKEYDKLYEILRSHYIVRWKASDILHGYKQLPKGVTLTLAEAVQQETVIKIDLWGNIGDKYIEMSTFVVPMVSYPNGKTESLNNDKRSTQFEQEVKKEVDKYYSSNKPLKMAKRMFSLAKHRNDGSTIKKILPLLSSSLGKIGQIISDADTAGEMISKLSSPPLDVLIPQFDNLKSRLSTVADVKFNENKVYRILDNIVNNYHKLGRDRVLDLVDKFHAYLSDIISPIVIKFLKHVKLYPPPQNYLP